VTTHEWVYTSTPTGSHVATHESFSGQPVQADVTGMQSALDKPLTDWLGHLKATAESTSPCRPAVCPAEHDDLKQGRRQ